VEAGRSELSPHKINNVSAALPLTSIQHNNTIYQVIPCKTFIYLSTKLSVSLDNRHLAVVTFMQAAMFGEIITRDVWEL